MRAFLEIVFGCHHRHLSRVFMIDRQTYFCSLARMPHLIPKRFVHNFF